ncbi:MAG: phosphoadenosine phosphosulfate reductase [Rhodobacteraceae bacterium]|nr:phosphoadenosine phosphosulfate reductase [Alphaproteobacteria bacterium]NNF73315.1 phosphoadenosine phosphosulfate reductase [Paracoccaceae bacterium]NNK68355.1 phosphoadenosine phosphosulfate reductase [Paracoccaceae bacterium]
MSELVTLSDELKDEEWLSEIEVIGDDRGYYEPVGKAHDALFLDDSLEVLLVSFDTVASARSGSAEGLPHAMVEANRHGWSHLSILAHGPSWFRDPNVYGYFDRLVDDAFFEDFDHVVFYGAGMCGYAAAAFSVAAPGATVIAVAPQATLDPAIAPWDDRFIGMRRTDFSSRYGYAPDMIDAADRAFIVYDPTMELDAMHASLFRGPQVHHIRYRHGGVHLGADLQAMGAMRPIFERAVTGTLKPVDFYRALRLRHDYLPYLRNVLNRVHIEDRNWLTALLCRSVLTRANAPRFRHHLELSEHKLSAAGRRLPPPRRRLRAAERLPDIN